MYLYIYIYFSYMPYLYFPFTINLQPAWPKPNVVCSVMLCIVLYKSAGKCQMSHTHKTNQVCGSASHPPSPLLSTPRLWQQMLSLRFKCNTEWATWRCRWTLLVAVSWPWTHWHTRAARESQRQPKNMQHIFRPVVPLTSKWQNDQECGKRV